MEDRRVATEGVKDLVESKVVEARAGKSGGVSGFAQ